ncbi:MAG: twin-arginine translocase subunit TatC [bacterium]|nr:twin-arginine translocase subunit TatC [bacterium]
MSEDKPKPILEHIEDLRLLIIKCIVTVLVFSIAGFFIAPKLLDLYIKNVGMSVYYFQPLGGLYVRLKLALFLGVLFASPLILYFIWDYIRIVLNRKEYKIFTTAYTISSIFFLIGFIFSALYIAPNGLKFLTKYGNPSMLLVPMIEVNSMLSFVFYISIGFGLIMLIPAFEYTLCELGVINKDFLKKQRKFVFVSLLIISALITPTVDILTMSIMAGLGYLLYEATMLFLK